MINTKIISVSGGYRSGKTTLGLSLAELLPNAKQYAFADRLKHIVSLIYPERAHEVMAEEKTTEARQLLNTVGNKYRQRFGDDIWAKVLIDEIAADSCEYAVITDTRFAPEFAACDQVDATFVHLGNSYDGYDMEQLQGMSHFNFKFRPDAQVVLQTLLDFGHVDRYLSSKILQQIIL
jgi:hypothetical protein